MVGRSPPLFGMTPQASRAAFCFHVVYSFQADFDGALSVEEDGRVEDGAAVFVAVRRRVAPAAAPVDAERQLDDVAFLRDAAGLVVF